MNVAENTNDQHSNLALRSRQLALRMRRDEIQMVHRSHASHIGSILSVTDIVATLYAGVARTFPGDPKNPRRDRVVLSKGHAGAAIYAALAESGFFPVSDLEKYYTDGSVYSGHVSHKGVPGVEFSTGSLGQGVCVACGMALAAKSGRAKHHIYAIVGDGESEEGSVWEMALFAAHQRLSNFTVIVDHNRMQAMGNCAKEAGMDRLEEKWAAFGWNVIPVRNGNDCEELIAAFAKRVSDRPNVLIAYTTKGSGVSFMENDIIWHYRDPQGEDYERAMKELSESPHA